MTVKELKEKYPLYPVVKREEVAEGIKFSTLVRKKYSGKYYLIPICYIGETEARAVHTLHVNVHKYLMLGKRVPQDRLDNEQECETIRLNKD